MNILKELKEEIKIIFKESGFEIEEVELKTSDRKDLGDFQINNCMKLAGVHKISPREIADKIVEKLEKEPKYTNINIAGPGFINLTLTNEYITEKLNKIIDEPINLIEKEPRKTICIDYGGANVAKALHVGHLRSANIGEALKRLATALGHNVIGDAHLGDYGRPLGLVIREIKENYKDSLFFDESYEGSFDDVELPITNEDLEKIYPIASQKAKEDENYLNEAREIANKIQNHERGYYDLWKKVIEISKKDIKKLYEEINVDFELWNGESDAMEYFNELNEEINKKNILKLSEGAQIIEVAKEEDKAEIPPLLYIKSNGTISYETTDLATIIQRKIENKPDETWYVVDSRQSLHFEQVFRAAKKIGLVKDEKELIHIGFGTMNGNDGKPFKTRDGGVLSLKELINIVHEKTKERINKEKISQEEGEQISKIVAIAALKYADLVPYRETDYIFEVEKFTDIEGKTGPYILYSTIRMKSLLNNTAENNNKILIINDELKELYLKILDLPNILLKSIKIKSLNEIADYLYNICSLYNTFYSKNKILTEESEEKRKTYIATTKLTYDIVNILLDILSIKIPEKM